MSGKGISDLQMMSSVKSEAVGGKATPNPCSAFVQIFFLGDSCGMFHFPPSGMCHNKRIRLEKSILMPSAGDGAKYTCTPINGSFPGRDGGRTRR